MKIFISHQKSDSELAAAIAGYFHKHHKINCYLDLVDPNASEAGDQLGEYLRSEMGKCTQLMAVVSEKTKQSWWVPWEIGVATEKDYPIATFAGDNTELPEYLKKWPYLKNQSGLDAYAEASKKAEKEFNLRKSFATESDTFYSASIRHSSTQEFYRSLRSSLGQ